MPEHDPNDMTLDVPRDRTPEQAAAVFEILDHLQVRIWGRYGPSIQQVMWDKQMAPKPLSADGIDEGAFRSDQPKFKKPKFPSQKTAL